MAISIQMGDIHYEKALPVGRNPLLRVGCMYRQIASAHWPKAGISRLMQPIMRAIALILSLATSCPADDKKDVRVVSSNSQSTVKQRPSIVFVSGCLPNGLFWAQVESFMRAAADDLGIDLEVLYAEMSHLCMFDMAKAVIHRPRPPDYLIADNYKQMAEPSSERRSEQELMYFSCQRFSAAAPN